MRETLKADWFDWVVEPLLDHPSFLQKPMFGCLAYYLHGKLVLVTSHDKEPWRGLLMPTERECHESLLNQFPQLKRHPVLGKWLYLAEGTEEFEETARALVGFIRDSDPRFGVITYPKRQGGRRKRGRTSSRGQR